jgi:hypothetical protein
MRVRLFGALIVCVFSFACAGDATSPAAPEAAQAVRSDSGGGVTASCWGPCPTPTPTPCPTPTPTPTPTPPPPGDGCSPGYWKNHETEFAYWCGKVPGWTCGTLYTAITCRGSNASCRRSAAADALNAVSGCTE